MFHCQTQSKSVKQLQLRLITQIVNFQCLIVFNLQKVWLNSIMFNCEAEKFKPMEQLEFD